MKTVDTARSLYYGFFSKMFIFREDENRFNNILEALDVMIKNPIDSNSKEALIEIKEIIEFDNFKTLKSEFDDIFHDPTSEVIKDTASYYDEQVQSGKKRLEVKNFLAKTEIRRDEKNFKENEDSVGFLVTFMHELVELVINKDESYKRLQYCLFKEIMNEFIDEYIEALYEHKRSNVYKSVAVILNAFIEFERLYFDITKPAKREKKVSKNEPEKFITTQEAKRRERNRKAKEADNVSNIL